jgi:hypothetical protein
MQVHWQVEGLLQMITSPRQVTWRLQAADAEPRFLCVSQEDPSRLTTTALPSMCWDSIVCPEESVFVVDAVFAHPQASGRCAAWMMCVHGTYTRARHIACLPA